MSDGNYRVESYGALGTPQDIAWTPNRWLALKIRDLCHDHYVMRGHRAEVYVVSHPDSDGWIEWEENEKENEAMTSLPWACYHLTQPCQGCGKAWVTSYTNDRQHLIVLSTQGTLCERCYQDEQYTRDYLDDERTI